MARAPLAPQLLAVVLLLTGCAKKAEDLREWKVADHEHTDQPNPAQVQGDRPSTPNLPAGLNEVTIVAWKRNCMSCHGVIGRGDGPRGAQAGAADLSRPEWQAKVEDSAIAATIRDGRGAMPAFPQLPASTVSGLVKLVRLFNRAKKIGPAAAPSGSASTQPPASGSAAAALAPRPSASPPRPSPSAQRPSPSAPRRP